MEYIEILKMIKEHGTDSYFIYKFTKELSKTYGVSEEQLKNMVDEEAEHQIRNGRFKGEKKQYPKAIQQACENILNWLEYADTWTLDTNNLKDLVDFISNHRRACTWAVIVGKYIKRGVDHGTIRD